MRYWKQILILVSGSLIFNLGSKSTYAQQTYSTASATVSATIVAPIGITKIVYMNFGNLDVGASSGKVILNPIGTRSFTGGITLASNTGTVTAAAFQVTGEGCYTYTIPLPSETYTLKRTPVSETMLINNFTSVPLDTGKLLSGTQEILIGATLIINADQNTGEYISETGFNVTVNYN